MLLRISLDAITIVIDWIRNQILFIIYNQYLSLLVNQNNFNLKKINKLSEINKQLFYQLVYK